MQSNFSDFSQKYIRPLPVQKYAKEKSSSIMEQNYWLYINRLVNRSTT